MHMQVMCQVCAVRAQAWWFVVCSLVLTLHIYPSRRTGWDPDSAAIPGRPSTIGWRPPRFHLDYERELKCMYSILDYICPELKMHRNKTICIGSDLLASYGITGVQEFPHWTHT